MDIYGSGILIVSVLLWAECSGESPEQGRYNTVTLSNNNEQADTPEDNKNLPVIIGSVVAAVVVIAVIVIVAVVCFVRRRNKRRQEKRDRELKDYLDRDWIRPPCETNHQETKPFILSTFYSHDPSDHRDDQD